MTRRRSFAAACAALLLSTGPLTAQQPTPSAPSEPVRSGYTAGDVQFMTGMIGHHSQAVLIAGWAPTHGASASMRALCERIVVGQNDEIRLMKHWLSERNETIPDDNASHAMMPGMDMGQMPMMPGMLSADQLAQLDKARGPEFDRLFLTFMIQHHRGALTMVDQLFATKGAGEEEKTFRLASDIYADQSTEIDRMNRMLAALPSSEKSP
jgi:uncharacterized protein (DUF305 family)